MVAPPRKFVNQLLKTHGATIRRGVVNLHDGDMTDTNNHLIPSTKRLAAFAVGCLTLGSLTFGSVAVSPSASAADADVWEARLRCDPTGCLLASPALKDSDRDGVSDADEIAAGTDPYNPLSRPSLKELIDLASVNELPSFAMTLGQFMVFPDPAVLMKDYEKPMAKELQGAFDSKSRESSLAKLGIKPDLVGPISGAGDILSIVNPNPTAKGSRPPGAQANYMDLVANQTIPKGQQQIGDLTVNHYWTLDDNGKLLSADSYAITKDGDLAWEKHCPGGKDCETTGDGYVNPDDTGDVTDPRFVSVATNAAAFERVVAKLGYNTTPANIGGVDIAGADVAEVVARNCGGPATDPQANTVKDGGDGSGQQESVCTGVGMYDTLTGAITVTPSPPTYQPGSPRTVQNWNPPLSDVKGVDPLGGR